jgi:hypothetical protein
LILSIGNFAGFQLFPAQPHGCAGAGPATQRLKRAYNMQLLQKLSWHPTVELHDEKETERL